MTAHDQPHPNSTGRVDASPILTLFNRPNFDTPLGRAHHDNDLGVDLGRIQGRRSEFCLDVVLLPEPSTNQAS